LFYVDFTFTDWKRQKGYTTMETFSIAKLEEELGLYGYLHNSTSMCNRTDGIYSGSTNGWRNGKIFLKWKHPIRNKSNIDKNNFKS
jgi:hypothetical protein